MWYPCSAGIEFAVHHLFTHALTNEAKGRDLLYANSFQQTQQLHSELMSFIASTKEIVIQLLKDMRKKKKLSSMSFTH